MTDTCKAWTRLVALLAAACWLVWPPSLRAADSFTWHSQRNRVDADIRSWELPRLLEEIATVTGWRVLVEPGTSHTVSTRFKDRPIDKALDLLLGDLSYVQIPQTSGPPRLLVFRTSQGDATQLIPPRDEKAAQSAKPIPNELIVTLKPGASIDDLARKLGAKVVGRSKDLNAARLQFEDADAAQAARQKLLDDESVGAIDPNFTVLSQPSPDLQGGGTLNLRLAPLKEGDGLVIGLIDSAVQRQGGPLDAFLLSSISVVEGAAPSSDQPTHGTAMWETMLRGLSAATETGAGSRVRVLPVDVYGDRGGTTTFEVAEGILRAMNAGASVINLSLGSDGDTPYLHDIIKQGQKAGRVFVASAGNEPVKTPTYPAAYPEVIAVTAGDGRGGVAAYANRGDFVDVVAPGTSMIPFNGQTWRVTGTSPATADFAGRIAGKADATGSTPVQAAANLLKVMPQVSSK